MCTIIINKVLIIFTCIYLLYSFFWVNSRRLILCVDISEQYVWSVFTGGVSRKKKRDETAKRMDQKWCSEASTQSLDAGDSAKSKNTTIRTQRKFVFTYLDCV
jgi:hypothetical protein